MSRKFKLGILAAALIVLTVFLITSCDRGQQYAVAPQVVQPAPVIAAAPVVQAPPVIIQQSHDDGFWHGVALGHMLSSGPTVIHHYQAPHPAYVAPRTTIVNRTTVINKTVHQAAPVYTPPARSPAPMYVAPRATSVSGAYSPRSSYSSSSYSSSSRSYSSSSYSSRSYSSRR
ncbi:hypothetical protein [Burkholderia sp. Ac-20349]|uniref:hypothetical protein n=1 Tax=Burkholderia sp. Ac-20349 TaxID=2703893 RepID=UPI00197BD379|nr:hypothetical protein [Burkholderia sp. Ac-20349]MBN3839217.1 hypothetical protein [Burkholderia sp. Ac-20349]